MDQLIQLLIFAVIFAVFAFLLYYICTKFFPGFPPALWICGVILLIVVLGSTTGYIDTPFFKRR